MTTQEMQPLLDHPDPQVKKLAEHYATLWDAAHDLCYVIGTEGCDVPSDELERVETILARQPNVDKNAPTISQEALNAAFSDGPKCCPDCERPNQFGELCQQCLEERQNVPPGTDIPEPFDTAPVKG